jgi:hypothetical protein
MNMGTGFSLPAPETPIAANLLAYRASAPFSHPIGPYASIRKPTFMLTW